MGNIKAYNPVKLILFTAVFLLMNIAVQAQDTSSVSSPSTQGQYPPTRVQSPSTQGQSPAAQDLSFNTSASQLSNELIRQTGISTDKSAEISQVLVDYRNNIAEARNKYFEDHPNASRTQDVTGSQSSRVDMKDILGDNVEEYYSGVAPDLLSDYKDADKKADNAIKDVFDTEVQKSRYEQIKGQWWKDVKDKVFPSLSQNLGNQNSGNQIK